MSKTDRPIQDAIYKDIFNNAMIDGMPSVLVGDKTFMEFIRELDHGDRVKYSPDPSTAHGEYKFAGSMIYGLPCPGLSGWLVGKDEDIQMLLRLFIAAKDKEIQQFLLHYKP